MRLFGLIAVGFWLTMMTLLVKEDVLPAFGRRGDPGYRTLLLKKQNYEETTMGIYVGEQKIGFAHEVIRPNSDGGYVTSNETDLDGGRLGVDSKILFRSNTTIDAAFRLAAFDLSASVFGAEASVRGTVFEDVLIISTEGLSATGIPKSGASEEKRIPLDGPMTLSTGLSPFTGMPELEVGKEWTIVTVDPIEAAFGSLSTQSRRAHVEKKETITWEGTQVETFVVKVETRQRFARECTAWITKDGEILKQRVGLIEMRLER
ncbi:MAG: hypothetical protein AAB434_12800 [Planctomycetota bacterium]